MTRILATLSTAAALSLCVPLAAFAQARYTVAFGSSAPFNSDIFIADPDGANAIPLVPHPAADSNASFSNDGEWVLFTSARTGPTKVFRVHPGGSGLEQLTDGDAFDDQAAFSPDGRSIAFVSTRSGQADVWTLEIATRKLANVTNSPAGDFRPSWSADGRWLAFSSDRDPPATRCLGEAPFGVPPFVTVVSTSVYVAHPDGSGLRRVSELGRLAGTPRWSGEGAEVLFYDGSFPDVCGANTFRRSADTQIVTFDVSGGTRRELSAGPGTKAFPRMLPRGEIAYALLGADGGISVAGAHGAPEGGMSAPDWSPALGKMVFHREVDGSHDWKVDPGVQRWYSRDPQFALQRTNTAVVGCSYSPLGDRLVCEVSALTASTNGLTVANADGSGGRLIFEDAAKELRSTAWSPDGQWIAFGYGAFFEGPNPTPTRLMLIRPDGSEMHALTSAAENSSMPSWSPDGKEIVYRYAKGARRGLAIVDVASGKVRELNTGSEHANFPSWSPRGDWISFTSIRDGDFDVYAIRPDGTDVTRLTHTAGNDAHASFSPDGEWIAFATARGGFKDEAILLPNNFQPYGEIAVMRPDGSDVRVLTDNATEEGAPVWGALGRASLR